MKLSPSDKAIIKHAVDDFINREDVQATIKAAKADVSEKIRKAFLDGWVASFKGAELSPVLMEQAEAEAIKYAQVTEALK